MPGPVILVVFILPPYYGIHRESPAQYFTDAFKLLPERALREFIAGPGITGIGYPEYGIKGTASPPALQPANVRIGYLAGLPAPQEYSPVARLPAFGYQSRHQGFNVFSRPGHQQPWQPLCAQLQE